ncbi:hypothetical protein SLA2020_386230 [Shorea laevis]
MVGSPQVLPCFAPLAYSLETMAQPSPVTASLETWQSEPCSVVQFESAKVQPVSLFVVETKPMKCYNRKTKDNMFMKMDDRLIVDAMSMLTAPPVLPIVVLPKPSVNIVATVKADVRKSPSVRGFLQLGFLPSFSAVPIHPQPTPDVCWSLVIGSGCEGRLSPRHSLGFSSL